MSKKRHKHEEHEEHVNHERWLVTYADMITLLMVLFLIMATIPAVPMAFVGNTRKRAHCHDQPGPPDSSDPLFFPLGHDHTSES